MSCLGYRKDEPRAGNRQFGWRHIDGQRVRYSYRDVAYYCTRPLCGGVWVQREYSFLRPYRFAVCANCAHQAWVTEQRGYLH